MWNRREIAKENKSYAGRRKEKRVGTRNKIELKGGEKKKQESN